MKNFLFLDFDGVINENEATYQRTYWKNGSEPIEPELVARVGQIVKATGARVVLSTAWRHQHSLDYLRSLLVPHIPADRVIDITPDRRTRGREIYDWLMAKAGAGARVAILDDNDTGMFDMDPMRRHFVKTPAHRGVLAQHQARATELLIRGRVWRRQPLSVDVPLDGPSYAAFSR